MIRLAVADSHALIRAGYHHLATRERSIRIIGDAADAPALLALMRATPADVVALDVAAPDGFLHQVRPIHREFPDVRILALSLHPQGPLAIQALREGAAGYVAKSDADEIMAAVRKVHTGKRYVSPSLGEWMAAELQRGFAPERGSLSAREREVLAHLAEGRSYKEIAVTFSVSPKTVGTYRHRLLRKLGLQTTADLIRYAVRHELKAPRPGQQPSRH